MFNILCRLFSRNTQILAQSKRTDSIHNTEINRFCISPLQICHFIKWYMEYLGSCHSVNIARLTVCLDQLFVTGTMRQNTKLDLRIIRIYKDAAFFGTNTLRIRRPSSIRTGIFCRFGSVLLIRPVAVIV